MNLTAPDGTVVATYYVDQTGDVTWAILTGLLAPPADVAAVALRELSGQRLVTADDAVADLLVAAGGRAVRRAHDYEFDLAQADPGWAKMPAPQGFRLHQEFDTTGLAKVHATAYPAGHVDEGLTEDHLVDMREMLAGQVVGPLVPEACWQVDDASGPYGAVLVVDRPVDAWHLGRTWVIDLFVRAPGHGLGTLLLRRALAGARRAGYHTTGLVVTEGNPARRVYERLGFAHTHSGTSIDLP